MTKKQAGRKGGKATFEKYGREYMSDIGSRGGYALHQKYSLQPYGTSDFVLVDRITGERVARLSGRKIA